MITKFKLDDSFQDCQIGSKGKLQFIDEIMKEQQKIFDSISFCLHDVLPFDKEEIDGIIEYIKDTCES